MEKSIDELISEETEQRLKEISSPNYTFPPKVNYADYIGMITAIIGCLFLILLCMTGVIT